MKTDNTEVAIAARGSPLSQLECLWRSLRRETTLADPAMDQIERLIARWRAHGIACPAGVTGSDICAFESRHKVRLPDDLRSYFLAVDGMGERGTSDEDFFSFWRLSDVVSIAEEYPDRCSQFADASCYFMFADHSISLPSYAIRLSADLANPNPIATVFTDFGILAVEDFFQSFTGFVTHYLDDPFETSVALPL